MFIAQKDPLLQIPLPYTGCGMFDYRRWSRHQILQEGVKWDTTDDRGV